MERGLRRGYTLIELIVTLVVSSILALGTFKAIQEIYLKWQKTKTLTHMTLDTQSAIDQIGALLYDRINGSEIRYDTNFTDYDYTPLFESSIEDYPVFEWIGRAREVENNFSSISMFIDLNDPNSDPDSGIFRSPETNGSEIDIIIKEKFGFEDSRDIFDSRDVNIIFPIVDVYDLGWHGSDRNDSFDINISEDGYITFNSDALKGKAVYAIYHLVDSAYAVARGADIDLSSDCIGELNNSVNVDDDTLLLFYNFRPWRGETFCGDYDHGIPKEGNVTVLMQNVTGFHVKKEGGSVRIKIDSYEEVRGASRVHISKQKVIF
jgi:prepilin-type N-terminal cleavage/methylation domain-containing protein